MRLLFLFFDSLQSLLFRGGLPKKTLLKQDSGHCTHFAEKTSAAKPF